MCKQALTGHRGIYVRSCIVCMLRGCAHRVATCQGKVREKQNFLQVRELSGNFEKMSGNFGHFTNVREMSGNFVMAINFFWTWLAFFFACIHFQVLKFLLALLHSAYIPIIPFSKCFITSMSTVLYYCFLAKTFNIDIGIFNCFSGQSLFLTWKNKINCQGKMVICQGIVREMSGNFEPAQMWQPCAHHQWS